MTEPLEPNDIYDKTSNSPFDRVKILSAKLRQQGAGLRTRIDQSTKDMRMKTGQKMSEATSSGGVVDKTESFLHTKLESLKNGASGGANKAFNLAQKTVTSGADLTRKSAEFITKRL